MGENDLKDKTEEEFVSDDENDDKDREGGQGLPGDKANKGRESETEKDMEAVSYNQSDGEEGGLCIPLEKTKYHMAHQI